MSAIHSFNTQHEPVSAPHQSTAHLRGLTYRIVPLTTIDRYSALGSAYSRATSVCPLEPKTTSNLSSSSICRPDRLPSMMSVKPQCPSGPLPLPYDAASERLSFLIDDLVDVLQAFFVGRVDLNCLTNFYGHPQTGDKFTQDQPSKKPSVALFLSTLDNLGHEFDDHIYRGLEIISQHGTLEDKKDYGEKTLVVAKVCSEFIADFAETHDFLEEDYDKASLVEQVKQNNIMPLYQNVSAQNIHTFVWPTFIKRYLSDDFGEAYCRTEYTSHLVKLQNTSLCSSRSTLNFTALSLGDPS